MKAVLINHEAARLEALKQYEILDTAAESAFDDLARLASYICGTPGIIHSRSKNSLSMSWARNRSALVRES